MSAGVNIRTVLRPGDISGITALHARIYFKEYQYGVSFESYVAAGLAEFFELYNAGKGKIWMVEHAGAIVGSVALMGRGEVAQLRFFLLDPAFRGQGIGKRLLDEFMKALQEGEYKGSYLWTTEEQAHAISLYKRYGYTLTEEKVTETFDKRLTEQRYDMVV